MLDPLPEQLCSGAQPPRADAPATERSCPEAPNGRHRRVSELLEELAETCAGERLSLGDIVAALGDRSYGLLMPVLALPSVIPGLGAVAALLLAGVALQMALGLQRPWLPPRLLKRTITRDNFIATVQQIMPWLLRLERLLQPRLLICTGPVAARLIGAACVILAVLLSLPTPFTNIPLTLAVVVLSLAVLERDCLFVIVGLAAATLSGGLVVTLTWGLLQGFLLLAGSYLGL